MSVTRRFESKVDRRAGQGPRGECHEWTAATVPKGYGTFRIDGRMIGAHRVAWFLATGEWPNEWVLHTCDNPPCVRFDHLFEGTPAVNSADMRAKGRARALRGEQHGRAKLSHAAVEAIRASSEPGVVLASRYGVSPSAISRVRNRRLWT